MNRLLKILCPVRYKGKPHQYVHDITDKSEYRAEYILDGKVIGAIDYGYPTDYLLSISQLRIYEPYSEYRHQGIATDLLYHVLEKAPYIREVRLSCTAIGGENALDEDQLDRFYQNYTYGLFSRKHIAYESDSAAKRKKKHVSAKKH